MIPAVNASKMSLHLWVTERCMNKIIAAPNPVDMAERTLPSKTPVILVPPKNFYVGNTFYYKEEKMLTQLDI